MLDLIQAKPMLVLYLVGYLTLSTLIMVWLTAEVAIWITSDNKQEDKSND
jgi:hypothetical protein